MSVKVEKISGCKVKLSFTLKPEEFDAALDKAFEKKVKDIEISGFRKGKLPRAMYNSKFGEESLYEEAINIAVNEAYSAFLPKSKLEVVDYPELDVDYKTIGKGKKVAFTLTVDVWPDVEVGQYKEIEVEKEKVEVSATEIAEHIERTLKQHAELEIMEEGVLENGQTAVFDFEGFVDGVAFEGGKAENYSLEIGSGQFIPGFEEQMLGMKIAEEKVIKVKFPDEYQADGLAGKNADFAIKIHEIKKRVTPQLTDEFVAEELEMENIKTVEQYKEYIEEIILKEKTEASENKFVDDLFTIVVNNAKVELPESMITEEMNRQLKQIENQAKAYGLTAEQLLQYSGVESLELYKETIRPNIENSVKQRVVFLKIAEIEKFKVTQKEYEKEIKTIAQEMKVSEEEAMKRYSKESILPYIQMQKVDKLIKDSAIIK